MAYSKDNAYIYIYVCVCAIAVVLSWNECILQSIMIQEVGLINILLAHFK